jgi:hypothetical protein
MPRDRRCYGTQMARRMALDYVHRGITRVSLLGVLLAVGR